MLRIIATFVVLLIGSAAASLEARAQQSPDGRKTIGVISNVGDTFRLQKVGITVFGNDVKDAPIDNWGIDDLVVAKITALVSKRFAVKKISTQRGVFAEIEQAGPALFRDVQGEYRARVQKLVAGQKCDLYLVLTKSESQFGDSNQYLRGLGMVQFSGFTTAVNLHAFTLIRIFDGHTFETLREETSTIGQATFMATIKGPHRELDERSWPESGQVTGNGPLKAATWALLEQSLAVTIPTLIETN